VESYLDVWYFMLFEITKKTSYCGKTEKMLKKDNKKKKMELFFAFKFSESYCWTTVNLSSSLFEYCFQQQFLSRSFRVTHDLTHNYSFILAFSKSLLLDKNFNKNYFFISDLNVKNINFWWFNNSLIQMYCNFFFKVNRGKVCQF